jgi:transcriptional regulator with XRE-family HTH domain
MTTSENVMRGGTTLDNGAKKRGRALTQEAMLSVGALSRGERLRWLMEFREVKQTELALKIGLTQSAISNLVTDRARKPSAPTLLRLADVLGCQPLWLLHGDGDPFSAHTAALTELESSLLDLTRQLSGVDRHLLLAIAHRLAARQDA